MTAAHVWHGLDDFIPRSRDFRLVVAPPDEILDWTQVPEFRESGTAREHPPTAGYTQGVSLRLRAPNGPAGTSNRSDERRVGTECGSTARTRGTRDNATKKTQ